ncbi:MAG TPA: hypothetical protein VHX37_15980 [Acidobacteriaceae bacterium]|jgi:hypothetical protein|nr:hypothetical protein [Acidobacteriaceae bacterium]
MNRETLALAVVRAASVLVPRSERTDWLGEWKAELWHLCRNTHSGSADPLECSVGAWKDAFWIRSERLRKAGQGLLRPGSAQRCGFFLGGAAVATLLACLCLPRTRSLLLPSAYPDPGNLVVLASNGEAGTHAPSIRFADYREWTSDTSALFTSLAWYRPAIRDVYLIRHRPARLHLAEGSQNLLQVLELPHAALAQGSSSFRGARLILTRSAWRRAYGGNPAVIGQVADIDRSPVLIAAVVADRDWSLAGETDAILLEPEARLAQLAPEVRGFGVARIRTAAFPAPRDGWRWMTETKDGVTRRYECISVNYRDGRLESIFIFAVLLALLALPATTALPLGDVPRRRGPLPHAAHARRWLFLAAKFCLVGTIVFFVSTALACELGANDAATAYIQFGSGFAALLLGFRWILEDQRRRCPECLLRLSNPARVGQASCNFLAWNGTELFCARGHGLLHIPELPTSWFSTQRWLCLDPSWSSLFAESSTLPAELL